MEVILDTDAGFCFGVERAISLAEEELSKAGSLYCLEDLVHNQAEVQRLKEAGLKVISREQFRELKGEKVLLRAHGEPPETYRLADENQVRVLDASCPIVLKLQQKIAEVYREESGRGVQIVIYGKKGHAEVNGLLGQVSGHALVVQNEEDLEGVDWQKPVRMYSQTTMSAESYEAMGEAVRRRLQAAGNSDFVLNRSFCRQVSGRTKSLRTFAAACDVVVFASDSRSSNGAYLYGICKEVNPRSYFVSSLDELQSEWFSGAMKVGVTGATSTPKWFMEKVMQVILSFR